MTNIEKLQNAFQELKNSDDFLDYIFDFKELLLSSDSFDFLNYHYMIMNDNSLPKGLKSMIQSFFWAEAENERDIIKVSDFLYDKYTKEKDALLKSDLLQILGHLRSNHAKEIAYENILSPIYDLRYKSIIVLGWVGNKDDLKILNESLKNDSVAELRGYSATAMRQIWYEYPNTKDVILHYLKEALDSENENDALIGIIITVQDLLKRKLGLKESNYGDVSGDIQQTKLKAIESLKNY